MNGRWQGCYKIALGAGLLWVWVVDAAPGLLRAQEPPRILAGAGLPHNGSLAEIQRASVSWQRRAGPVRQVVDAVCLVPDLATFLEAIAAWDESHAFPILIDDAVLSPKFVQAFRPARIIRYPRTVAPIPPDRLWEAAMAAVVQAWGSEAEDDANTEVVAADMIPLRLQPTPPGVVLSSPSSTMLAGAVALSAGRFQPLIRWETFSSFGDLITRDDALELAQSLQTQVGRRIAHYRDLGDDCDFVTLAGDWPYRYRDKDGPAAFDDLIARSPRGTMRWAFAGRLLGDPSASLYRAMCSLFLQPEAVLLLDTYDTRSQPWSEYALTGAADRLSGIAPVTLREANRARLVDWRALFEPAHFSRFNLVLINSRGGPTDFNLTGGSGRTDDIPISAPAAVLMIHSFSATDPHDPETIAGRWLARGAFIYFGAMNEPYVQAFHPFGAVADLLAQGVPLGAAVRRNPPDRFGQPWRLVYLGDPLYRLEPRARRPARLPRWEPIAAWPAAP